MVRARREELEEMKIKVRLNPEQGELGSKAPQNEHQGNNVNATAGI